MSNIFCPGYLGIARVGGTIFRCTDCNINMQQEALFYDHVIGLRDTIPTTSQTKGETDVVNLQKTIWRPSTKIVGGSLAFPATENNIGSFFEFAKRGRSFNLTFQYHTGEGREFESCKVSSWSLSCTAGDICNVSVEVMGVGLEDSTVGLYTNAEKLITWDKVDLTPAISSHPIQAFNININNPLIPIYTSTSNSEKDLWPLEIRVGMQEVSGTISFWGRVDDYYDIQGPYTMTLTILGFSTPITVLFQPVQPQGSVNPIITTIPFVGIDRPFGS